MSLFRREGTQHVFPLPAVASPFRPSVTSRSRRVWQRYHHVNSVTKLANQTIASLNSLSTSFSSASPLCFNARNQSSSFVTASQSRMVAHVYSSANRFVSRQSAAAAGFNSTSSGEQDMCDPYVLSDLSYLSRLSRVSNFVPSANDNQNSNLAAASVPSDRTVKVPFYEHFDLGAFYCTTSAGAVPIVADKVSLPSSVGSAKLLDLLPPDLVQVYSHSETFLSNATSIAVSNAINENVKKAKSVKPICYATPSEYVKLIRRMHAVGMVEFTLDPKVVNGVFGVPKDQDSIRLIIDARPANIALGDPPKVHLPTPDIMSSLLVPPNEPITVAKVDLDNFYHRLKLPNWLKPYFALPSVCASDVGLESVYGPNAKIYPCCTTLPMGWSHSVFVAQSAHEHLIHQFTDLKVQDKICETSDLIIDRPRHQVYIDDLNLFAPASQHDELVRLQNQYIAAATDHGLPVKWSKVVAPTSEGVECLGLTVHGFDRTIGLAVDKLSKLCIDTQMLLHRGMCTGLEMSRLVGRWTWACLVHRPSLSVLNSVYRFVGCAGHRLFQVWSSVAKELLALVGLAPLLFASLDQHWFPKVVCTDASESGLGVVATRVCLDSIQAVATSASPIDSAATNVPISSRSIVKGKRCSLETGQQALATQTNWSTIVASSWQQEEHINVLEVRAVSTAVRWVLSSPMSINCRLLLLCDSLVTVFSLSKGRSSSRMLLPRLRGIAALLLGSGLRLYMKWIPTELNPADEPSRRHEPKC
jgi:hypothetical protein